MEYFEYSDIEIEYLKSRDPVLKQVIEQIGIIKRAVIPDLFAALVNSIVGQQISTKAHQQFGRESTILLVRLPQQILNHFQLRNYKMWHYDEKSTLYQRNNETDH